MLRQLLSLSSRYVRTYGKRYSSTHSVAMASSAWHRSQHGDGRNRGAYGSNRAYVGTAAGAVFGTLGFFKLGAEEARAEALPAKGGVVSWDEMVQRLRMEGGAFSFGTHRSRRKGGDWEYGIEFEGEEGCDLFGAISTALAEFGGEGMRVRGSENASRLTLEIGGEGKGFGMRVTCPRRGIIRPRVELKFVVGDGEEMLLDEGEVECIERVFKKTRKRGELRREQESPRGVTWSTTFMEPGGNDFFGFPGFDEEIQRFFKEAEELMMGQVDSGRLGPMIAFDGEDAEDRRSGARRSKDQRAALAKKKLTESFGVQVYDSEDKLDWEVLAGYDDVKRHIDDTLILPIKHPEVYEKIVQGTRVRAESNLPKAVLFEGQPGCGKTTAARVLASGAGLSFVHIPLESILSKYYGESTQRLSSILQTANELGRCLIFIDEIDSLGSSREREDSHEASRRILSVLLRHIDGLEGAQNSILCAATNRRDDLDSALLSRFDVVITFPLPDVKTRSLILGRYAKHLTEEERERLAEVAEGFSGRELQDACEEAERALAGRVVRSKEEQGRIKDDDLLPAFKDYENAVCSKAKHAIGRKRKPRGIPQALKSTLLSS